MTFYRFIKASSIGGSRMDTEQTQHGPTSGKYPGSASVNYTGGHEAIDEREKELAHKEAGVIDREVRLELDRQRHDAAVQSDTGYTIKSYVPHLILGGIAIVSILALAAMAYAPGTETQFIQNTLGAIALAATAALAGIVKGPGT